MKTILLRYEASTWKYCARNIIFKDEWQHSR